MKKGSKILKKGNWCPDCSGKIRWNIQKIKSFAQKKGGDCLSSEWNGWHKKLQWVCSKGHKWEQTPSNIISGGHGVEHVGGRIHKLIKLKISK